MMPFACSPEGRCNALLCGAAVLPRCRCCDAIQADADKHVQSLPRHRWPGFGDPGAPKLRTMRWLCDRCPKPNDRDGYAQWLEWVVRLVVAGDVLPGPAIHAVDFVATRNETIRLTHIPERECPPDWCGACGSAILHRGFEYVCPECYPDVAAAWADEASGG